MRKPTAYDLMHWTGLVNILLVFALSLVYLATPRTTYAATAAELQAQLDRAVEELDALIEETDAAVAELRETQSSIEEAQALIDETRAALNEKAKQVGEMQAGLATIIANDYKLRDGMGLIGFCLGATDFEDLVSRIYFVERISGRSEDSILEVREAQEEMMAIQRDLQEKKAEYEELAAQQEKQVNELEEARAAQQAYVDALPAEIQRALQDEAAARLAESQRQAEEVLKEAEDSSEEESPAADTTQNQDPPEESTDNGSSSQGSSSSTPQSQPSDSSGGSMADVANYIGPQASWSNDVGYISRQRDILARSGSGTSWGCVVDKGSGRCVVFRLDGGVWKAAMTTNVITTGHTFTGTFTVKFHARAYWALPDGYDVNDWWVCFIEAWSSDNYSGHLRYEAGKGYDDGQGFHYGFSSGGCTVISNYSTSQWLYDHVPDGSRVIVY